MAWMTADPALNPRVVAILLRHSEVQQCGNGSDICSRFLLTRRKLGRWTSYIQGRRVEPRGIPEVFYSSRAKSGLITTTTFHHDGQLRHSAVMRSSGSDYQPFCPVRGRSSPAGESRTSLLALIKTRQP